MNDLKKILSNIFGVIAIFVIVIASAWIFVHFSNIFRKNNIADAPITETPPQINEPQGKPIEYNKIQLLNEPFTPTQNVYSDTDTYLKSSIKLALNGEFKDAKLVVDGEVIDNEIKFVSVNIGAQSGILNAVRENANFLNIVASEEKGGVFNDNIKFTLDFFGETSFATTKDEFQQTRQKTKVVRLWDYVYPQPPTVVRVLVAPFNKDGQYGNVKITSIEFQYLCKDGKTCNVAICSSDSLFTSCLKDNFGIESAKKWCEVTNLSGCDDL